MNYKKYYLEASKAADDYLATGTQPKESKGFMQPKTKQEDNQKPKPFVHLYIAAMRKKDV